METLILALTTSDKLEIASVVCASILSLVLIGVTIVNVVLSIKANRAIIKARLVEGILNYDSSLYACCTKIVDQKIADQLYLDESIGKLDDANTELYSNIIKIRSAFPHNKPLLTTLDEMYEESEYLCKKMKICKDVLLQDIDKGWHNIKNAPVDHEFLVKDLLGVEDRFKIYVNGLSDTTIDFLKSFVNVYKLLDKIDYKKFMKF